MQLTSSFFSLLRMPLHWLFVVLSKFRRHLYTHGIWKRKTLPGITISIGNLEVGGTGKTPVTIALCHYLIAQGKKPAIVTRGYRSGIGKGCLIIKDSQQLIGPADCRPDEAFLQSHFLPTVPIIIGSNRYQNCQTYLQHFSQPTHWILDDGFQHLSLQRHFDILLLNASKPFANKFCLPVGRLREPPSTLRKADAIFLTRSTYPEEGYSQVSRMSGDKIPIFSIPFFLSYPKTLNGKPCPNNGQFAMVTAIARPQFLDKHLHDLGLKIIDRHIRRDHGAFRQKQIDEIYDRGHEIITTYKDFFRHPQLFKPDHTYFVSLTVGIEPEVFQHLFLTIDH